MSDIHDYIDEVPAAEHGGGKHRRIEVTVKTPAGAGHQFEFKEDELVGHAATTSVHYFVEHGQLAAGDYAMAIVRHGEATQLNDSGSFEDYGIHDGAELHLINKGPQVDGCQ